MGVNLDCCASAWSSICEHKAYRNLYDVRWGISPRVPYAASYYRAAWVRSFRYLHEQSVMRVCRGEVGGLRSR